MALPQSERISVTIDLSAHQCEFCFEVMLFETAASSGQTCSVLLNLPPMIYAFISSCRYKPGKERTFVELFPSGIPLVSLVVFHFPGICISFSASFVLRIKYQYVLKHGIYTCTSCSWRFRSLLPAHTIHMEVQQPTSAYASHPRRS